MQGSRVPNLNKDHSFLTDNKKIAVLNYKFNTYWYFMLIGGSWKYMFAIIE